MAYIEVKGPAGIQLPQGARSVSIPVSVAFKINDSAPDPTMSGPVDLSSMNPDFCDVSPRTVNVPAGSVGRTNVVATPLIAQNIGGQWVCDLMISAQTQDGTVSGGSANIRIFGVPAPPQPTTKKVTITGNGVTKSMDVPTPVTIAVEGVGIVYNSQGYANPIEPPGGGWGQW